MAILVRYALDGMTTEQYENVGRKLDEGGHWPPPGLLGHVGFGEEGNVQVSEVWESREQQEQFAQSLMPLVQEAGVPFTSGPEIIEVVGYDFPAKASSQET
jgi:hypothetical protein